MKPFSYSIVLRKTKHSNDVALMQPSHSPHLNAHIERFQELKQKYAAMRQSTAVAPKEKIAGDDETKEQTMLFKK